VFRCTQKTATEGRNLMASLRDRIWDALDYQFRSSADIARRAGVDATSAAPALGHMRQHGTVESRLEGARTLWRRWPTRGRSRLPTWSAHEQT
jgi:hypothetical protein